MGKNQDPGFGIRDKHPGSATLMKCTGNFFPPDGSLKVFTIGTYSKNIKALFIKVCKTPLLLKTYEARVIKNFK